jgi:hypothetical protein
MENAVKSPESAVYRRELGIFLTETPLAAAPKHFFRPLFPRNPHFPALRSVSLALSEASRRKQIPSSQADPAGRGWTMAMTGLILLVAFFTSAIGFSQSSATQPKDASGNDMSWLEPVPLVRFQTITVISPEPIATQGEILSDDGLLERLSRFRGRKGYYIQHLDSFSWGPSGTPATLQMSASQKDSVVRPPWDGENTLDPFVGWVIHYQPEVSGSKVKLGVRAAYAFPPGSHPAPGLYLRRDFPRPFGTFSGNSDEPLVLPEGSSWLALGMKTVGGSATLRAGEILCTSLEEVESGVHAVVLTGLNIRMPWGYPAPILLRSLTPSPDPQKKNVREVVVRRENLKDPTPEEKTYQDRIGELDRQLREQVDACPDNRDLSKLRDNMKAELEEATPAGDGEQVAQLRWKITQVILKMNDNCRYEFESLRREIKQVKDEETKKRYEKFVRSLHREEQADPKRFNRQEQ